ncbi:hypothetical protein [Archangium sp.]|uniref:hypothetical protein n=1 Tax=Archangium sp. TaxID=1872627 RepID=UPI00389A0A34
MNSVKTLGLTLTTAALLAGCGTSAPETGSDSTTAKARAALQGGSKKPVVEQPTTAPSACTALYSSAQARAALTQAVVDPSLATDGLVKTLILTGTAAVDTLVPVSQ